MTNDLAAIRADIARAREWASKRFNAYMDEEITPSHLLAPLTMAVMFPEPDTMSIAPVVYGRPVVAGSAEYKLCWKGNFLLRKELYGEGNVIELVVV